MARKVASAAESAKQSFLESSLAKASVDRCMRDAEAHYQTYLAEYEPSKRRDFCEYDGYYAFAIVFHNLLFALVLFRFALPAATATRQAAEAASLNPFVSTVISGTLRALGLCVTAASAVTSGDSSVLYQAGTSVSCGMVVTAIQKVLEFEVVKAIRSMLAPASGAAKAGASLVYKHWRKLTPVTFAHLLRTKLPRGEARRMIESRGGAPPPPFASVLPPLMAGGESRPLLLQYKPESEAKQERRETERKRKLPSAPRTSARLARRS